MIEQKFFHPVFESETKGRSTMKRFQTIEPSIGYTLLIVACGMTFLHSTVLAVPPDYAAADDHISLTGVGADNPLIYDNDWWRDVPDAAYLWAKASLGEANLKGNIVSRDMWGWEEGYQYQLADGMKDAQALLKAAKASGLKNIPNPIAGANAALIRPQSGKIEETTYTRTEGSDLIVVEAKRATPEKPLLVFVGGPCTTVATAYLTDRSIADRVIVFQIDGGAYNGKDSWSWQIALQRFRFVNWADGYFWGDWSEWQPERFLRLPKNPLTEALSNYANSDLGKANQWGDGAWIFALFEPRCISKVLDKKVNELTVPKEGTNFRWIEDEFFKTMSDPKVYGDSKIRDSKGIK